MEQKVNQYENMSILTRISLISATRTKFPLMQNMSIK